MSVAEVMLYLPGELPPLNQRPVGSIKLVSLNCVVSPPESALDIGVESHGSTPALSLERLDGGSDPQSLEWLQLNVTLSTMSRPNRVLGRVLVDKLSDVALVPARPGRSNWRWQINPEMVDLVERSRPPTDRLAPIFVQVEVEGLAKLRADGSPLGGEPVVSARGGEVQWQIEASHWERLVKQLGYLLPPSFAELGSAAVVDHPSWHEAQAKLLSARKHLSSGEDDDALRKCLSALEALVSQPYSSANWKSRLRELPEQKIDAIASLFSGFATYCNKTGHHRDRTARNEGGDLLAMPIDHWEADVAVACAQFLLAYAIRLRQSGLLT